MPPSSPPPNRAPLWSLISNQLPHIRHSLPLSEGPRNLVPRALEGAITVPQGYGNAPFGPSPGIVVGIVFGSVIGFLLCLAVFYWCINIGQGSPALNAGSIAGGTASSMVSRHRRPPGQPRRHHRHSRHLPRHEKAEHRRERVISGRLERDDEIVVQEYRSSPRLRSPSPPPATPPPPPPPRSVAASEGDNVIVVEEEHSTPRMKTNSIRSQHTKKSDDRRSAGRRSVDRGSDRRNSVREDVYIREVSRQRSRSRA
ncbi:hypothetical protein GGS21DRAFT_492372 [Xylaria nigripes]|nr:hypothetical protein GGS21DRAFT_492372 [Xylaria nigripes]